MTGTAGLTAARETPQARWTFAVVRHRDVAAGIPAGVATILLGYYLLLAQETSLHTVAAHIRQWPAYMWGLAVLGPLTIALFAANFAAFALLLRARAGRAPQAGTLVGGLVGGFAVACPSCGAFLLSAVGVTTGLAALPFAGLELWAVAAAIMAGALPWSLRRLQVQCPTGTSTMCSGLPAPSSRHLLAVSAVGVAAAAGLAVALALHEPW